MGELIPRGPGVPAAGAVRPARAIGAASRERHGARPGLHRVLRLHVRDHRGRDHGGRPPRPRRARRLRVDVRRRGRGLDGGLRREDAGPAPPRPGPPPRRSRQTQLAIAVVVIVLIVVIVGALAMFSVFGGVGGGAFLGLFASVCALLIVIIVVVIIAAMGGLRRTNLPPPPPVPQPMVPPRTQGPLALSCPNSRGPPPNVDRLGVATATY